MKRKRYTKESRSPDSSKPMKRGAKVADLVRELESENARLKKLLAEAELDKAMLKDVLSKKW